MRLPASLNITNAVNIVCIALLLSLGCFMDDAQAQEFAKVAPGKALQFPRDYGAHPDYRTEWWYVTGWLQTSDKRPLGFQITFFRTATGHNPADPSKFAPRQLILAHAALSDPTLGKLLHDQKSAREGFGLAYAKTGDTGLKLDDWQMWRDAQGNYHARVKSPDFRLDVQLTPQQAMLLQGEQGYSQKGPSGLQASYYYSEPQLRVSGNVIRQGKQQRVTGNAWLDHEWSTSVLDANSSGWDWLGANLDDGSALMAFRIRSKDGASVWSHATLRDANGKTTQYRADQVRFVAQRQWRSELTQASYPVAATIELDSDSSNHIGRNESTENWQLEPLMDNQELDARRSTGAVYWEGAVTVKRNGKPAGRGYLELTGYHQALKF